MKSKIFRVLIAVVLMLSFSLVMAVPAAANPGTVEVSQPTQLTTDPKFDRNPSFLKASDGTWWVFFARGRGDPEVGGYNPDADYYDICYLKSTDSGSSWTEGALPAIPPNPLGLGAFSPAAIQDDTGKIWVFYADNQKGVYYFTSEDGITWTGPTLVPNEAGFTVKLHLDAILANDGKIWLFYWGDPDTAVYARSFDGSNWSVPVLVGDPLNRASAPKALQQADGTFRVIYTAEDPLGIYLATSTDNGITWVSSLVVNTEYDDYDPVLVKDDTTWRLFFAPYIWPDDNQWLMTMSSPDLTTWSTPVRVTAGSYGANKWWDFWPEAVIVSPELVLFYASMKDGAQRGDGEIYMYRANWNLANDHFEAIQPAIDSALVGDTIIVSDGTYTEDITVNTANLTLRSLNGKAVTNIQLVDGVGIDIQGGASGFTLGGASGQGFTISPHATATTFDIQLANAPSGVEISYNTIDTTGSASMGISVGAAGASDLTISNNTFTADSSDGCIWGPNVADVTVSNNTISGGSYGVQFSGVTGTSSIDNNTISSCTGSGGVVISNGAGTSGLTITGNTITGCGNGIYFAEYTAQGTPANMTTVTVTYNYIASSSNDAIKISGSTYVLASKFTINYNAFINSGNDGLENLSAEQVTAEWNWWDKPTGPADDGQKNPYYTQAAAAPAAETCTLNVDFTPWMMHTSLSSGWNIYSTPITSGPSTDTISEALDFLGSGTDNYTIGYYFNGATQNWVQVLDTTPLQPMQAVYLNMSAAATINVCVSANHTAPPAMTMYQGWNLVGPAELYNMLVNEALTSAYYGTGAADLVGYSQVLSPSINQSAAWTWIRDMDSTGKNFVPTEGYWVYMVNQGTLGGFTYTPITPLP